jgi:uncharacterized protein YbjT (DUF2867 family)
VRREDEVQRIAVAGGTGVVGRHVVEALRAAGCEPVVLARSTGVDLGTGAGLDAAFDGVHAVVDVSNVSTQRRSTAVGFFSAATSALLAAGARAGVQHHVVLSIVGVDRVDIGYYAGKRAQEELVLGADVPATVLRATQFHEFAEQVLTIARGPVAPVPAMRVQPVAAREVGEHLVELVRGAPQGRAPELAGPEVHDLPDLVRRLLRSRGTRRLVLPLRGPTATSRAVTGGALLPAGAGPRGRQTFDEWLGATARPSAGRRP